MDDQVAEGVQRQIGFDGVLVGGQELGQVGAFRLGKGRLPAVHLAEWAKDWDESNFG